jgi:ferredoxin-NADP reductase
VPSVTVPLLSVTPISPRSRLVTLDLRKHPFEFRPGHAVLIGTAGERRPYSIANSPGQAAETRSLELLIALEADGTLGPHLPDITPSSPIDLEGPMGTFLFPEEMPPQRLLFVAGGTGIAPLRAMIDHVLRGQPSYKVSLLYSARNGDEFAFIEELRAHEKSGRLEVHQTVTRDEGTAWAGGRGRIGRSHFESVVHDPTNTLCFVCGPRAMVSESVSTLAVLGVPPEAIRTEAWAVPPV